MAESDSPSFEIAKGKVVVEPDTTAVDAALDAIEARLTKIEERAKKVKEEMAQTVNPQGMTVAESQPPQTQSPPVPQSSDPAVFTSKPFDDTAIDDAMNLAQEKGDRARMISLFEQMTDLLGDIRSKLEEPKP